MASEETTLPRNTTVGDAIVDQQNKDHDNDDANARKPNDTLDGM